ncbi:uncharacterized protein LOC126549882 [Aphis gossypii]|uniref:uncharacterized protein LOC126549882 n=1 Tax=Aphis gossypii TaxID=80765 RepID=UPI002158BC6C|nr:uncharacterized protein LOC126549882 [Aphis gossypii]
MQTLHSVKSRQQWTLNEKKFALSLFYKSPTTYSFLKNKLQVILPGVSTIKRWIGSSKFLPGYNSNLFNQIKLKTETLTGFEDLGHLGRTNKPASQALAFMARGLYSNWKLPVAYFFSASSLSHSVLNKLIISTVEKLLEVGLHVKAVVCDQGDFLFNDKLVSFKDIIKTYTIDKNSNTSKSLTKLTDSHINPGPFQKMNCKLAFQIFSNSVAATIHTCVATGELKSNTPKDTAIFVKHMNDLLDTLNSNSLFDKNPLKSALSENKVLQFLNLAKKWNLNLQKKYKSLVHHVLMVWFGP